MSDEPVDPADTPTPDEPATSAGSVEQAETSSKVAEAGSADEEAVDEPRAERSLLYYIGLMLSAVLLIFVVGLALMLIIVPKVTGSIPLTVLTSSMEPGLPPGTLVIVKPIDPKDIVIGDVVTYQIESGVPGVITHRIIDIQTSSNGDRSFIFQGDNNDAPDEKPVLPVQIQGKVWYSIPYAGYLNSTVNGTNRSWIIPVIAGALFVYATYMIISGVYSAARVRRINAARRESGMPPLTKEEREALGKRTTAKRR